MISGTKQLANYIFHVLNVLDEEDIYVEDIQSVVKVVIERIRDAFYYQDGVDQFKVFLIIGDNVVKQSIRYFSEEDDYGTISAIQYFNHLVNNRAYTPALAPTGEIGAHYHLTERLPTTPYHLAIYLDTTGLDIINRIKKHLHGREVTLNQPLTKEEVEAARLLVTSM